MNLAKGLALICGIIATIIALANGEPILFVSAPYWGFMSTTYSLNTPVVLGIAAAIGTGYGVGKLAGQTGGTLFVEGVDEGSRQLASKLKKKS